MTDKKDKFIPTAKAREILQVVPLTLHNWEKAGKIETIRTGGGHRLYNVDRYLRENGNNYKETNKNEKKETDKNTKNNITQDDDESICSKDSINSDKPTKKSHKQTTIDKLVKKKIETESDNESTDTDKPTKKSHKQTTIDTESDDESIHSINFEKPLKKSNKQASIDTLIKKKIEDDKINKQKNNTETTSEKKVQTKENFCYIRITPDNKNLLKIENGYLKKKYPDCKIIEDIGYSSNFSKQGFGQILDFAIQGKIDKLIITDNINLSIYELEVLQHTIKTYSNGTIIIEKNNDDKSLYRKNLLDDVIYCMQECVEKMNNIKSTL